MTGTPGRGPTATITCDLWEGPERLYQDRAARELDAVGRHIQYWAWIIPTCENRMCLEPEHLRVNQPTRIAYPNGVCIYCGLPGSTRDHILPRPWTGDALRTVVATVPACGTCNSIIGATITTSMTERRAVAHAGLRRKHRRLLATTMRSAEELNELGPTLRQYIEESMAAKRVVMEMLEWPTDPVYDLRAFERSGIDNPYVLGLIQQNGTQP